MASGRRQCFCCHGGLDLLDLCFMGGLRRRIDLLDAGQELVHCGDQIFLQQGDFFLAIGVIDPEAANRLATVGA